MMKRSRPAPRPTGPPRPVAPTPAERGVSAGVDRLVAFLVGALSGLQPFLLPLNLAIVDAVILYVMLVAVTNMPRLRNGPLNTFRACAPWLWMIAVGSVVGMFSTVHLGASVLQFTRDFYAYGVFFAVLAWLILKPDTWSAMATGVFAIAGICALVTFVQTDLRPSGTFLNPNYAGHFMAMSLVLLVAVRARVGRAWLLLVPLLLAGVLRTASFGGIVMLAGGVCVLVWVGAKRLSPGTRHLVRALLVAVFAFIALSGVVTNVLASNEATQSGLGENRLDKSSTGRLERWSVGLQIAAEHPFGIGPGGAQYEAAALGEHELHNDPLAYLVERSVVGLVGLVGFVIVLWRRMPRSGAARVLLGIVMVGSLVRETLNYRHVWIILAIALVVDAKFWLTSGRSGVTAVPRSQRSL